MSSKVILKSCLWLTPLISSYLLYREIKSKKLSPIGSVIACVLVIPLANFLLFGFFGACAAVFNWVGGFWRPYPLAMYVEISFVTTGFYIGTLCTLLFFFLLILSWLWRHAAKWVQAVRERSAAREGAE
jgi:uncharacterized protein involved in cysteine biosynthesis